MIIYPNWPCTYSKYKEESDTSSNTEDEISTNKVYFSDVSLLDDFDKLLLSLLNNSLGQITQKKVTISSDEFIDNLITVKQKSFWPYDGLSDSKWKLFLLKIRAKLFKKLILINSNK